jgi:hypothetical protein
MINMWLILIVLILHFTRHGIIYPFVPLLAEGMGASLSAIGFTVGAFSLIAVFLSVPLGGLVDRFGVKRLLLFGVGCNILNALILIRADTVSKLIIAQMIAGLAFLLHVVASQAYFSRLSDPSQREKGFGWLGFGASAGQSVGPILGGFLVDRYDYQAAFFVEYGTRAGGIKAYQGIQSHEIIIQFTSRCPAGQGTGHGSQCADGSCFYLCDHICCQLALFLPAGFSARRGINRSLRGIVDIYFCRDVNLHQAHIRKAGSAI